jgi:hypothetical protein
LQTAVEKMFKGKWNLGSGSPGEALHGIYNRFGFRYLTDVRQNIIIHPGLARSEQVWSSRSESGDAPFDFRFRDGRTAVDTSQLYTGRDYRDLAGNVGTEFLPNMVGRHPCLPSLAVGLRFLTENGIGGAKVSFPDAPFAAWMVDPGGAMKPDLAKDIQAQLNNLYRSYATELLASLRKTDAGFSRYWIERFIAIQLAAARDLAVKRYFHRALVFYNDLVDMVDVEGHFAPEYGGSGAISQMEKLFSDAPTKERIEEFSALLNRYLERQRLPIVLEIEQAAVLRAAGLVKSADFLWRRIIDQYRLFTLPMIELSVDYVRSVGFDPSQNLTVAEREISDYLAAITSAAGDVLEDRGYVTDAIRKRDDDDRATRAIADVMAEYADVDSADRGGQKRLDTSISAIQGMKRSVQVWIEEKILFRKVASHYLFRCFRGEYTVAPVRISPARYTSADGFVADLDEILTADLPERLLEWAALPPEKAAAVAEAGRANFILGWYWLDQGRFAEARSAFAAAARAYSAESRKAEDVDSLVARRNAMMMLLALASVTRTPPGMNAVKTDFLDGLSGQALMWERTWYARGHNGRHAARERVTINTLLPFIRQQMRQQMRQESNSLVDLHARYFFVDYRFRFGAVPDNLFADALAMKLFEKCPRHPDGKPNTAITPDDRDKYESSSRALTFREFVELCYPLVLEIDKDVLGLGR